MELNDHDHKDNKYDVSFQMNDYYDDLIRFVDDYVDDEMMRNEYDVMMMMVIDDYYSKQKTNPYTKKLTFFYIPYVVHLFHFLHLILSMVSIQNVQN